MGQLVPLHIGQRLDAEWGRTSVGKAENLNGHSDSRDGLVARSVSELPAGAPARRASFVDEDVRGGARGEHEEWSSNASVESATSPRERKLGRSKSTSSAASAGAYSSGGLSLISASSGGACDEDDFPSGVDWRGAEPHLSPEEAAAVRCDARLAMQQTLSPREIISQPRGSLGQPRGSLSGPLSQSRVSRGMGFRFRAAADTIDEPSSPGKLMRSGGSSGGSDPMEQNPLTLRFTQVDTEQEYFALKWGARRALLRRAVPAAATVVGLCTLNKVDP
jgi:hypothetical protein